MRAGGWLVVRAANDTAGHAASPAWMTCVTRRLPPGRRLGAGRGSDHMSILRESGADGGAHARRLSVTTSDRFTAVHDQVTRRVRPSRCFGSVAMFVVAQATSDRARVRLGTRLLARNARESSAARQRAPHGFITACRRRRRHVRDTSTGGTIGFRADLRPHGASAATRSVASRTDTAGGLDGNRANVGDAPPVRTVTAASGSSLYIPAPAAIETDPALPDEYRLRIRGACAVDDIAEALDKIAAKHGCRPLRARGDTTDRRSTS